MSSTGPIDSMHLDLSGAVTLVTGAGTGIGLMIAKGFAKHGAKVYITGRRPQMLEEAAKLQFEGGGTLVPLQMDVTDKESILKAVEHISNTDKKLDVLVNNAGALGPIVPFMLDTQAPEQKTPGTYGKALFDSYSFKDWSDVATTNISSIFFVTHAFLELLVASTLGKSEGRTASVINITSVVTYSRLIRAMYAYTPSKAGASHLTQLMSTDFALKGIPVRVNAIAPGLFASQLTGNDEQANEYCKTNMGAFNGVPVPLQRSGREDEMAALALYLATPSSSYTNGQEIIIDGGFSRVNP